MKMQKILRYIIMISQK